VGVRRELAVVAAVLAVAGCGTPDAEEAVELTPDGFAEVVADHVDRTWSEGETWDVMTRELGVESPGASFRGGDGDFLAVAVTPDTDNQFVCTDESFFDECVDLTHDGHELVLAWQELEPEEDPGVVYVIERRDDEAVLARYSGASITGDPRELDLGVTVDQMADIVTDGRLTLG
jgi:hypothetical protein